MSVSKVKTITIAVLLLLNALFLTMIAIDYFADARNERQVVEDVCAVLRNGGVDIDPRSVDISGADVSSMSTALLRFLAVVRDESRDDVMSTVIYSVEVEFVLRNVDDSGERESAPVWLVSTDTGRFMIDDETGEVIRI